MPEIRSRLEELVDFCLEVGYLHLELVSCYQLAAECRELSRLLGRKFTVEKVFCRICAEKGSTPGGCFPVLKNSLATEREFLLHLKQSSAELFVDAGLCASMDVLLAKYSLVPVSTLAVRDPLTAHDPLGMVKSPAWRQKFGLK